MKKLSCGVLIVNDRHELFLAHVTNTTRWDIPKGGANPNEPMLDAALRELEEETGLEISPGRLIDLGRQEYSSTKNLHLFLVFVPAAAINPKDCFCRSQFRHPLTRKLLPEMDGFRWAAFSELDQFCVPAMRSLLTRLDIAALADYAKQQSSLSTQSKQLAP